MGATLVVYLALPATRTAMLVVMGVLAAAAIACGCVEQRPPRAGAWALFAVAIVLLAASEVGFDMVAKRPTRPHPSGADLVFIAAYLPLAVALLWLGHPRAAGRRWPAAVDAAILSLGCTLVVWILLIRPTVIDLDLSGIGKITAIGSWVGTVTVFAAAVLLLVTWRSNIAAVLLGCAIAALMVTDLLYGAGLRDDVWHTSEPLDLGVFACCVLLATAALVSAMTRVASIPIAADQLSVVRLVVLATALLIAPTALLVEATNGSIHNGIAIATISVALTVLLLVRGALAVRMLRRRGLADRAAADAARTLDFATDVDSVRTALNEALAKILDGHGNGSVVLDVARSQALPSIPRGDSDVTAPAAALRIQLTTTDGTDTGAPRPEVRFYGPRAQLVDLSDVFSILAGQAATALHRIELATLRLDKEKQQYFRTLVLNSTDVILICRNGTVAYASPSAMTMFGRDVVGEPCADLVTPRPSSGRREHAFIADTQEEGSVVTPDGVAAVVIHRRDLTDDPTVAGHVLTLRDVTTQLRLQRELAFRASHDSLTGLANRELFRDELRLAGQTGRTGCVTAVLFIDLDDFKQVNDSYGHQIGDALLVTCAGQIRACLRDTDVAARLGGDEFAVLLRDLSDSAEAYAVADRISEALSTTVHLGEINISCAGSIGVSTADNAAQHDALLRRADIALYAAKAAGKNQWRAFQPSMMSRREASLDLRSGVATAVDSGTLTLRYQPVVSLATGEAGGFEALAWWAHPSTDTNQSAAAFARADKAGLGASLDMWILDHALADIPQLCTTPGRFVSVNISSGLLDAPGFATDISDRLSSTGTDPSSLMLEIPEDVSLRDHASALSGLITLHDLGVRIALDNYGTGSATLANLRQPTIDAIKLDQSFATDLLGIRNRRILNAVIGLAEDLGTLVIATQVDDRRTLDDLVALGCRHAQGILFAPAVPLRVALAWRGELPQLPK